MRSVITALAITASLVLAGCGTSEGSADSQAPLQSMTADGAVAGDPRCHAGPPPMGRLQNNPYGVGKDDGVVGAIYNDSAEPIYIKVKDHRDNACRLDPGSRAAYMGVDFFMLEIYAFDSVSSPFSRLRLADPFIGRPSAFLDGPFKLGQSCAQQRGYDVDGMKEGTGSTLGDGAGAGVVEVNRLNDDKNTAIEWSGIRGAGDWARIDVRVKSAPVCS